jgi:hypothetical protein
MNLLKNYLYDDNDDDDEQRSLRPNWFIKP